jgi:hypothetical protein
VIKVTDTIFGEHCCYFSHSEGWARIMAQPSETQDKLVSIDASEWTDNLPASLQYIVMKSLFGQKIANAWKVLAVDCDWFVPHLPRPFRYGKGQGMGTKGSFAIAQLTDLIFVRFLLEKHYPEVSSPFFIKVGDDLVVFDPAHKLAGEYERIGVPVNIAKSKFKTPYGSFVEFVSRNAWNGKDYSIISPALIPKFIKDDFYAATLYHHVVERSTGILTDFHKLMLMKKAYLQSKKNFNLEVFQERYDRIMRIIAIVGYVDGKPLYSSDQSPWRHTPKEEILNFLEIWLNVILGEILYKILYDFMEESTMKSKAISDALVQEHLLSRQAHDLHKDDHIFFANAVENGISLKEAFVLKQALPILQAEDTKFSSGIENLSKLTKEFLMFTTRVRGDIIEVNVRPTFLANLLNLVDQFGQNAIGYKTLKRLSLFDKANTKSSIYLHKHLYTVLSLKESPLNWETGEYTPPFLKGQAEKSSSVMISPNLIRDLSLVYRFDDLFAEIANVRSDSSMRITLRPNNPT